MGEKVSVRITVKGGELFDRPKTDTILFIISDSRN